MKYIKIALVLTAALTLAITFAQPARADISFDVAYSNLSEHGSWLVSTQYGHVWQPREYNRQWSPYYDGHWVYTDVGWTWVSDYEWGAIPYHYGTWVNDPYAGWVWIPGQVWAPAWVVFRTTPEYIGWAPVPPGFSVGMSIDMGGPSGFVFVSSHDFLSPRLSGSFIPRERANVFMNSTTVVNNIVIQNNVVINRGPDYKSIERATGRTIREEHIESVARVAPYEHVTRAELAVAPERVKHGVRVAEPVPASQPLPVATQHGRPNEQGQGRAPAAAAANGNVQPDAAAQQQHAKPQTNAQAQQQQHAKAQSDATAQQQQHAKAQSNAQAQQQHAKAQSDATAQQQQHAKAQSNAQAQQQHAKAQPNPEAQKQNAKPQPDAKAKKDQPQKKDQGGDKGGDKGGSEEPKNDSQK